MKKEKRRLDYQPPKFKINEIYLEFELDPHHTRVTAVSKVERNGEHSEPLVLDGENLTLEQVLVDGKEARFEKNETSLTVYDVPSSFELKVVNYIDPASNLAFEGLYMSDGAYCTQCEAEGFRKITYYLDRPDVSAKFTTRIIAPKDGFPYLLSNGNRVESGDLPDGRHYVVRQDPYSKPSYLFALVAGDFDVIEDHFVTRSGRDVELQLFVDRGSYNRGIHAMNSIKKAMKWDEDRFGLEYDLDLFQVVAVDFFNMGAMENKGLNIFNSKCVLADAKTGTDSDFDIIESVIGHEYFHNWTGDRVTCRDWFQLSLKEGLTVFRDQEFSSDVGSRSVHRIQAVKVVRGAQFAEDLGPMAHPIRPDLVYEQNNFYTVTVYDKGAEVIRMIHTLIGEKAFQAGMKLYISRFDGGCATCDDFVQAMQDASGYDLTRFRNWYCYDGTPLVEVSEEYDHESGTLRITFRQSIPSTPYRDRSAYPAMVIPLKLEFLDASGRQIPVSAPEVNDGLFVLTEKEQTVTFSNVTELPAVSYLGDFSAPVKISRTYSSEELLNIASHTANDFNRYEAIWQLYTNFFRGYVEHNESDVKGLIDSYAVMLANPEIDRLFLAEILAVPTEVQIASMFENVDIERIHEGREYLLSELAVHLNEQWQKVYRDNYRTEGEYSIEPQQVAQRALANLALGFVARFMGESADSLVKEHYYSADNMTDTLAALKVAVHAGLPCSEQLLAEFDEKWHEDGLIMDNWFRIQASVAKASTLAKVKELMNHRSFTMTNPNRIRALIGTFAMANPFVFHAKDASGYEFITEILTRLNESNPQTAARIIDPMIKFKRYDQTRQKLIAGCLEKLFALPQLAPDLYEKIARALGK